MQICVASGDEDEDLTRGEWTFALQGLVASFVRFRRWQREAPLSPWVETGDLWTYPDVAGRSTVEKPDVPGWVLAEVKQRILSLVEFDL